MGLANLLTDRLINLIRTFLPILIQEKKIKEAAKTATILYALKTKTNYKMLSIYLRYKSDPSLKTVFFLLNPRAVAKELFASKKSI